MRRIAVFVYGSLLSPAVLTAVIGRAAPTRPARIEHYRRCALRGLPFPGLLPCPGACTDGALIGVTPRELRRLDRYEDDYYRRVSVRVRFADGESCAAVTYVLAARFRGLGAGRGWLPATFSGAAARRVLGR